MAEDSAFWDGTTLGDAGPYSSNAMAKVLRNIAGGSHNKPNSGPLYGSGVSPSTGLDVLATTPNTAAVKVYRGAALVHGTLWITDVDNVMPIAANSSGNTRIDTVVLTKNWATQTIRLEIEQGTPAASPVPPTLVQTDNVEWQVPLADVTVASGFSAISNPDIRPRQSYLPGVDSVNLVDCLNNSGGTLERGDVVIWDTTAERAVKTTTTDEDPRIAGVWQERTAAGSYGKVMVQGITPVALTSVAASVGQLLYVSATAKRAKLSRTAALYNAKCLPFGHTLHSSSLGAANIAFCYINVPYPNYVPALANYQSLSSGTATNSATFVDITNGVITVTIRSTKVRVYMSAGWSAGSGGESARFNIYNDGLAAYLIAGDLTTGPAIMGIFTGLTPGSHTFRPRVRNAGGGTLVTVNELYFVVEEIME